MGGNAAADPHGRGLSHSDAPQDLSPTQSIYMTLRLILGIAAWDRSLLPTRLTGTNSHWGKGVAEADLSILETCDASRMRTNRGIQASVCLGTSRILSGLAPSLAFLILIPNTPWMTMNPYEAAIHWIESRPVGSTFSRTEFYIELLCGHFFTLRDKGSFNIQLCFE